MTRNWAELKIMHVPALTVRVEDTRRGSVLAQVSFILRTILNGKEWHFEIENIESIDCS